MKDIVKCIGFALNFILTAEIVAARILASAPIRPIIKYHIEKIAKGAVAMLFADSMLFCYLRLTAELTDMHLAIIGLIFVAEGFAALQLKELIAVRYYNRYIPPKRRKRP